MHIHSRKEKDKAIQSIVAAPILYVPLLQHIGKPAKAIVSVGDFVKKFQLVGQASEGVSANIHSPVSGIVEEIRKYPLADGNLVDTIIIRNDYKETEEKFPKTDLSIITPEQVIEIIAKAGIVGVGGAQFPTALKYQLDGFSIETFIVNGTECEPYLSSDYVLMKEYTAELFKGIELINKVLKAKEIVLTIEEQNKELADVLNPFIEKATNIRLQILPNEYPQGGELQLINRIKGQKLPRNKRPRDFGVIVNNVGTIYAVYQAVVGRVPLVNRIFTVSGKDSPITANYEIKIGTSISHIIKELNLSVSDNQLILGGAMMGKAVIQLNAPVIKGSSGLLLFKRKEFTRFNCISCGYCVEVCPMRLLPMKFEEIYRSGKYFRMEKYHLENCIECAACEYICPSNVPLIESIKESKIKIKELAHAIQ